MTKLSDAIGFGAQFVRHPSSIGAVAASSRALAERMCSGAIRGGTVVELGPGTGAITQSVVDAIGDDGQYVGIESNEWMAGRFRDRFPDLDLVIGDAADLVTQSAECGIAAGDVDAIVCSLPWSVIAEHRQRAMLDAIRTMLGPGGLFVTYAYVHGYLIPGAHRFRRLAREQFDDHRSSIVWFNLPPAIVHEYTTVPTPPGS